MTRINKNVFNPMNSVKIHCTSDIDHVPVCRHSAVESLLDDRPLVNGKPITMEFIASYISDNFSHLVMVNDAEKANCGHCLRYLKRGIDEQA